MKETELYARLETMYDEIISVSNTNYNRKTDPEKKKQYLSILVKQIANNERLINQDVYLKRAIKELAENKTLPVTADIKKLISEYEIEYRGKNKYDQIPIQKTEWFPWRIGFINTTLTNILLEIMNLKAKVRFFGEPYNEKIERMAPHYWQVIEKEYRERERLMHHQAEQFGLVLKFYVDFVRDDAKKDWNGQPAVKGFDYYDINIEKRIESLPEFLRESALNGYAGKFRYMTADDIERAIGISLKDMPKQADEEKAGPKAIEAPEDWDYGF